ncbi:MAG TPA: pyridoxamine 5'-phosphate oxidase family protein [Thermoanaerobaculia bacterium]|nr:pyridoxamine 5'-phosphate oxidase family protein [Thermoanaerobaculia bacterium]
MSTAKRANGEESKGRGSIDELWKLVEGIETAMLTTRRADGHLVSRPMATQKRSAGADFWFVTMKSSPKVREIAAEPRVNLSYYRDRTREWVSVSGEAIVSHDRGKIHELWAPDWKAWFEDEGGGKDGGPDDPRIVLVGVKAVTAQYMTVNKPQPLVLFEVVKGMVTGKTPQIGEVKEVAMRNRRTGAVRTRRPARGERD